MALGVEIAQNCSTGEVMQGLLPSLEEEIDGKGEEKRPSSLGDASLTLLLSSAGHTFLKTAWFCSG